MAANQAKYWRQVDSLLSTTYQKNYDQAVTILRSLREVATTIDDDLESWEERVRLLRAKHARKSSLMERFDGEKFP